MIASPIVLKRDQFLARAVVEALHLRKHLLRNA
jgi:hypothetical protein